MTSAPAPSELAPEARVGEIVDARYRIVQHLGTGGMASVYRAEHVHNGSVVAIKVLHGALAANSEILARFRREALAARSIRHPNVVSVWDVGRLPDGCCFMVLEFIPGRDVFTELERQSPLPQVRAVGIAAQVAHALVAAHAAGVIHRDLKPDNIMLIEYGGDPDFVKVVDFGIAKVNVRQGPALTVLGSVFGTPEYMAPEQAKGAPVDQRTDLYALGTLLYEMLVGHTPFWHKDFGEVLLGQISKAPPPLPPTIDAELAALIMRLLAKDPAARVQSATELRDALGSILGRLAPGHPALTSMTSSSLPTPPSGGHRIGSVGAQPAAAAGPTTGAPPGAQPAAAAGPTTGAPPGALPAGAAGPGNTSPTAPPAGAAGRGGSAPAGARTSVDAGARMSPSGAPVGLPPPQAPPVFAHAYAPRVSASGPPGSGSASPQRGDARGGPGSAPPRHPAATARTAMRADASARPLKRPNRAGAVGNAIEAVLTTVLLGAVFYIVAHFVLVLLHR